MQVLQGNLKTARAAHDLLEAEASRGNADLLLTSEPHKASLGPDWFQDCEGLVGIRARGLLREKIQRWGTPYKGIVWVEIAGVRIHSCYASPNAPTADLTEWLAALETSVRQAPRSIVAGDINAKAAQWGSVRTDERGLMVLDLMSSTNLVSCSVGNVPTFVRGNSRSRIDVTLASAQISADVQRWRVLDGAENMSDHHTISWTFGRAAKPIPPGRWAASRLNKTKLAAFIAEAPTVEAETAERTCDNLAAMLQQACVAAVPRIAGGRARRQMYWWCDEVAEARKLCQTTRRTIKRHRAGGRETAAANQATLLREQRRQLRLEILRSKERAWKRLCDEVDADPWGLPYRLVAKKLGARPPGPEAMVPGGVWAVVTALFATAPSTAPENTKQQQQEPQTDEQIVAFTMDELQLATARLPNRKAPGPDGIPNELVKATVETGAHHLLDAFNSCLQEGMFPGRWKVARLVLIPKPGKPLEDPSSYRPLCMLDGIGKLLERLIANRLLAEVEARGGLNNNQYGFRRGRSTVDAIQAIQGSIREAVAGSRKTRRFCLMVSLDVKNAFNTLPWREVMRSLDAKQVTASLKRIIASYLSDRWLELECATGPTRVRVVAGVPQGSVLGPLLWNLVYDGVLGLQLPAGVQVVGFADDLAVVSSHVSAEDTVAAAETAIELVGAWLRDAGLTLAPNKTEAAWLTRKRSGRDRVRHVVVGDRGVPIGITIKYLGIHLEANPLLSRHVEHACTAAGKTEGAIARIMPNLGGPGDGARRLLAGVARARLLYAAPVWQGCIASARNAERLRQAQRSGALRISRAYRTVSTEAVEVLASWEPADLLLAARGAQYAAKTAGADKTVARAAARVRLMEDWQCRWSAGTKGAWTRRLIPVIRPWIERSHGASNHWWTQVLTGHGCFMSYLARIGKARSGDCLHCQGGADGRTTGLLDSRTDQRTDEFCDGRDERTEDTAEHTLFQCPRWAVERACLQEKMGAEQLSPDTLVPAMLADERTWLAACRFSEAVLRAKDSEQRALLGAR